MNSGTTIFKIVLDLMDKADHIKYTRKGVRVVHFINNNFVIFKKNLIIW